MKNISIQTFERYEFKYFLTKNLRTKIENDISKFMTIDQNAKLNNKYFVRSLYFDDDFSTEYYNKTDGMKIRHKFRLRTYSSNKEENIPIFLEIKGRNNQRTYKKRITILKKNLSFFENKIIPNSLDQELLNNEIISKFFFEKFRRNISPKIITDYWRSPYVSEYDRYFRLTFDNDITIKKTNRLFENNNSFIRKCLPGFSILEIKFNRRIPKWFHRIIQSYNLTRLSISKFCLGMETADISINLE